MRVYCYAAEENTTTTGEREVLNRQLQGAGKICCRDLHQALSHFVQSALGTGLRNAIVGPCGLPR